jgi:hypothetical protein
MFRFLRERVGCARQHSVRLMLCAGSVIAMMTMPALASAEPAQMGRCVGLTCGSPGDSAYVLEAHGLVPALSGLDQAAAQTQSGFYDIPAPVYQGDVPPRVVVYLAAPGQSEDMPASVRELPAVTDLELGAGWDRSGAALVVIDRGLRYVAPAQTATASRRGPRARAADGVPIHGCQDRYFCQYGAQDFLGGVLTWYGPTWYGTGWHNLNSTWNNITSSMVNHRDNGDSLMADGFEGGGTRYCAQQHSEDSRLENNAIGDNAASSIALLPSTDDRC